MKRGGDLPRHTPLNPGGELSRSTPLRRTPMPQPSPRVRTEAERRTSRRPVVSPEERQGRRLLHQRSGGLCEIDAATPATDAHHRKNRSQGGTWQVANLMHLCHEHHMAVTVNPAAACKQGWSVRSHDDPEQMPALLADGRLHLLDTDGSTTPYEEEAA